jgi:GH15 family glucan-1,4-alpha-glucosidase
MRLMSGRSVSSRWRRSAAALLAVSAITAMTIVAAPAERRSPWTGLDSLHSLGLAGSRVPARSVVVLRPGRGAGEYVVGTSLLQRPSSAFGQLAPAGLVAPVLDESAELAAAPAWLARGTIPGRTATQRDMATRALLDLRLLTYDNGATIASPTRAWSYVWPRDASWVAAAFAATGHPADAEEVLAFLAKMQRRDGRWDARYLPRSDRPVRPDGRPLQLDAVGWVPWAIWFAAQYRADGEQVLQRFWSTVRRAADAAVRSLRSNGLPQASPDWWETGPVQSTVGTAAALLSGLRASADVAARLDHPTQAAAWSRAASRLQGALDRRFAPRGYPRSLAGGASWDAAIAWLAPPFAPYDSGVAHAVALTRRALRTPSGAVLPGSKFPRDPLVGWTAPTAFFALADAASGRDRQSEATLNWLAAHRTSFGALSERVDAFGRPSSVAPLGWTGAVALLTMVALDRPLPVPPVRLPASPTGK